MARQRIPVSKHEMANEAYLKGEFERAVELQVEIVGDRIQNGKPAHKARKLLAVYLYHAGEFDSAFNLLKTLGGGIAE